MSKERWFAEFERALNDLEDAGDPDAYDHAADVAHERYADRLADMGDAAKDRAKEAL